MVKIVSESISDILVFSPHIDDEVLGCFSFLGKKSHIIYFGVEERPTVSKQQRLDELSKVADFLGFQWQLLNFTVNHYQVTDLIGPMEAALNTHKPTNVLIPEPSYNQDHRAVYDAAIVATRPHDINWFAPNILVYEQPHSVIWPHTTPNLPTYFRVINIEQKLFAYQLYESQIRGHRSPEIIKALARLRGAHICASYAEAYFVKRIVKLHSLE
jgi:LmbE family N-acetylglucosaminyl deacetylase